MSVSRGKTLFRGRLRGGPTRAAVEAHARSGRILHDRAAVRVADDVHIDVVHGGVVVERAATPVAAVVPHADVTETVIDAAVEADARSPVAGVPDVDRTVPPPVTRCP